MTKNKVITRQLAAIGRMDVHELKEKFAELFGVETNSINVAMLRKRLAYRIQEIYFGGLTSAEKSILSAIAQKDPMARLEKAKPQPGEIIKGTRFSRQWRGRIYEVIADGNGHYEYNGRLFRSLSAIAKEITKTQWNGKLFFGAKEQHDGK